MYVINNVRINTYNLLEVISIKNINKTNDLLIACRRNY